MRVVILCFTLLVLLIAGCASNTGVGVAGSGGNKSSVFGIGTGVRF